MTIRKPWAVDAEALAFVLLGAPNRPIVGRFPDADKLGLAATVARVNSLTGNVVPVTYPFAEVPRVSGLC